MDGIFVQFLDVSFVDYISELAPLVGAGFALGLIVAIVGWVFGFVVGLGRLEP